jgi:hypothetical protein
MEENDRLHAQLNQAEARHQAELAQLRADCDARVSDLQSKLDDRAIAIDNSESLADAALRLSGTFAAAQHAIDLYGYNVEARRPRTSDEFAALMYAAVQQVAERAAEDAIVAPAEKPADENTEQSEPENAEPPADSEPPADPEQPAEPEPAEPADPEPAAAPSEEAPAQ